MKKLLFALLAVLPVISLASDDDPIIESEISKVQTFYQDPEEYGKIESNKYFIRICIEGFNMFHGMTVIPHGHRWSISTVNRYVVKLLKRKLIRRKL